MILMVAAYADVAALAHPPARYAAAFAGDLTGSVAGLRYGIVPNHPTGGTLEDLSGPVQLTLGGSFARAIKDVTNLGNGSTVTLSGDLSIYVRTPEVGSAWATWAFRFSAGGIDYRLQVGFPIFDNPNPSTQGDVSGSLSGNATLTFLADPFRMWRSRPRNQPDELIVPYGSYSNPSFQITTAKQ
jgi:hypothetical protein